MANVTETAKVFNTPNYSGDLYTASPVETPFLTMIGGLGGGKALSTQNKEFPTCSLYEHPEASQPTISENASLTAPSPYSYVRTQEKNVTQIFHETISVSYAKMANRGRLSGINTQGQTNNAPSELDFQTARKLEKIARDMEFSFLNGTYNVATTSAEIDKTRGMLEAAGTQLDATTAELDKAMIDGILKEAWKNGALFKDFCFVVNGTQKQKLTKIYNAVTGFQLPPDRNFGGLNIVRIDNLEFQSTVAGRIINIDGSNGTVRNCIFRSLNNTAGISATNSTVAVEDNSINNCSIAVQALGASTISCNGNTGNANDVGFLSTSAIIFMTGNTVTATTLTVQNMGGQIFE